MKMTKAMLAMIAAEMLDNGQLIIAKALLHLVQSMPKISYFIFVPGYDFFTSFI